MHRIDAVLLHYRHKDGDKDKHGGGGVHEHADEEQEYLDDEQDGDPAVCHGDHQIAYLLRYLVYCQNPAHNTGHGGDHQYRCAHDRRADHHREKILELDLLIDDRADEQDKDDDDTRRFGGGGDAGRDAHEGQERRNDGERSILEAMQDMLPAFPLMGLPRAAGLAAEHEDDRHESNSDQDAGNDAGFKQRCDRRAARDAVDNIQQSWRDQRADGGTLFLDEIAEMPLDMQSVLLRVLEEGEITRIGGSKSIPVNVRLIAATNQNLEDYIHSGKFRLDLFYRLNIISLNTIPLREHKADIDALADSFISKFSKRHNKPCDGISAEARSILHAYDWPGNTRELRNVIERGIITMSGRFIETHDLPPELMRNGTVRSMRAQEDTYSDALISDQESSRKKAVAQLMREYDGNKAKVARSLGIARSTLYRILKERE